jgi:VanZ family protein
VKGTGDRLTAALFGYFALVISVITLSPFDVAQPQGLELSYIVSPKDVVANIVMFAPVGFLWRGLSRTAHRPRWEELAVAAGFSIALETAQLFIRDRYASPVDVLTNTLGAYVGSLMRERLDRGSEWEPGVIERLGLHLPLGGLIYLLVPQLWLSAVGVAQSRQRSVLTIMLGCAGCILIAALRRHRWQRELPFGTVSIIVVTLLWLTVGAFPTLIESPAAFASTALTMVFVLFWLLRTPPGVDRRRFEIATLRRFLPLLAAYVLLAALWPPVRSIVPWHGAITFGDRLNDAGVIEVVLLLEQVCGFTLLGYAAAEWRGRRELSLVDDLPRPTALAATFALVLELMQGFLAGPGASAIRPLLSTSGAVYGVAVYHLARAHVRSLRAGLENRVGGVADAA